MASSVSFSQFSTKKQILIQTIYDGFVERGYIDRTITINQVAAALIEGSNCHRGYCKTAESLKPFLKKTIKKLDRPTGKTHVGTFQHLRKLGANPPQRKTKHKSHHRDGIEFQAPVFGFRF